MWRGPALGNATEFLADEQRPRLEAARAGALEDRIETDLALGRHRQLVPELTGLVNSHPVRERLRAQLMTALFRCDRQGDALAVYHCGRKALSDELGVDPGSMLHSTYLAVLNGELELPAEVAEPVVTGSSPVRPPVPGMLPPASHDFTGRQRELGALFDALRPQGPGRPRLSQVTGMAGVGKSALALRAAHCARPHFPDGQLYADLRHRDGWPKSPDAVLSFDALGILLIAERASLLSGRDDEFVAVVTKGYTGVRWGELVGLEKEYCRPENVRVEWQLYELDTGELVRCPPKDDSYRTIDSPPFLSSLLRDHIIRMDPKPCGCHGRIYVFRGYGAAKGAPRRGGVRLADVAWRAEVSTGTVSNVLNRPGAVKGETRLRVEAAIAELGYMQGGVPGEHAAHWRRSGFATWLFQPAATGWYPKKAPQEARPVPLLTAPWPGVPARGRNAASRAEACWVPIARGLTPHGLRHTNKKIMRDLRTPPKLMDERLGHLDGSVQARYDHISPEMRQDLMEGLTAVWEAALAARLGMCPTSPVRALDALLQARR